MTYVDGFIVPVPKRKLAAYRKMARAVGKAWMEYGALSYVECVGDDTPKGKLTSFPRSVKLKAGEVVVFAWITYKSRKSRDAIQAKIMKDKRFDKFRERKAMPFDGKRMIFGGFKSFIEMRP